MEHTKGRWVIGHRVATEWWTVEQQNSPHEEIGIIYGKTNAYRIVACVNACEGINPEAVPDLLAACKAMLQSAVDGECSYDAQGNEWPEIVQARAATAKARGTDDAP